MPHSREARYVVPGTTACIHSNNDKHKITNNNNNNNTLCDYVVSTRAEQQAANSQLYSVHTHVNGEITHRQDTQLSGDCAMLRLIEYFAKSLKVIWNDADTLELGVYY